MTERRGRGRPKHTQTDTGAAIADAALERFAARGYEAVSLREIAEAAKVDVALIAYRFGGKIGLWRAIVTQAGKDLHAALDAAAAEAEGRPALARLDHAMRAFVSHLLARPEVPRLLLRDLTIDGERSQWLLGEMSQPLHRHFFALAQAAAADCSTPPLHPQFAVANFIYGAASAVARRERLTVLVDSIADDAQFRAALEATLIDAVLYHG